ncbi:MAG: NAD(P)/FAD-dependent oxidoreductase [bacterium]|nr:NAD(P)/FAD-dependent oxidoreductase [bacterium]
MEKVDIIIIGAGVVGLAIASKISDTHKNVALLEKNRAFGQEISSRNSEVIHAGIYYKKGTLKSRLCIEGNPLLYELCSQHNIPHRKTGKLIVAATDDEEKELINIYNHATSCGAPDLSMITKEEVQKKEPLINARAAISSGSTGIVDSHALMSYFEKNAKDNNCMIAYDNSVTAIDKVKGGFILTVNNDYKIFSRVVINSAGLYSDKIAKMTGIDIEAQGYKLYPCKGEYYCHTQKLDINTLIYPIPVKRNIGLGVHITIDMDNRIKFGPNTYYVNEIDYKIDDSRHEEFFNAAKKLLPFIEYDDIAPDMAGIRPKLQGPDDDPRDFVIKHENDIDLTGLINLVGIESPGLTSSIAIAEYVSNLVEII